MLKHSVAIVTVLVLVGCTVKKTEKVIIQERQAPEKISESMQTSTEVSKLILQKNALGKAFLMTPTLILSQRTPQFNDFKPQVVAFEKSGDRVGLFRLSANNIYSTIPTDKLLQTFRVISETSDSVTIDISHGIRNLTLEEHLSIVDKDSVEKNMINADNGLEETIMIKEALVRKTEISDNIMFIEQAVRIGDLTKVANKDQPQTDNDPMRIETTAKVIIELKPYKLNNNFKPQLFDKEQRVGYFINFASLEGKDQPLPQITKWDLSDNREPITVALEENIPAEIVEAVIEGVTYWNRVVGRDVLKIRKGFKAMDRVSDRMIVVRWVQWDSAGFAYASMQADPMSGEILRAQIFMTSSWLVGTQELMKVPLAGKKFKANGLCVLNQSDLKLNEMPVSLSKTHQLKAAQDVIRTVVAHEMGHVMGLRHNFSGSLNHEGTDADLIQAKKDYLKDEKHGGLPFSSTVMDYERQLATALIGAYIKNSVMPYDKAAIGWGYKQEKIELAANTYCSDEHIMLANAQGADVYGCERFDEFKNPTLGALQGLKSDLANTVGLAFQQVVSAMKSDNPYQSTRGLESVSIMPYISLGQLENLLFTEKNKFSVFSISTVLNQFKMNMSYDSKIHVDGYIESQTSADLQAVGGVAGIISQSLDLENNNVDDLQILEKQVKDFSAQLDASQSGLSELEVAKVMDSFLSSAKQADRTLLPSLMQKFVPVYKGSYTFKSMEEYEDAQKHPEKYPAPTMRYRDTVNLGNAMLLMSLFKKAVLAGANDVKKVTVNGHELEMRLLGYSNYYRDALIKAFVLENWPLSKRAEIESALNEQLQQLKQALAANTVAILQAAGKPIPALTYADLNKALSEIPSSQISGIQAYELQNADLGVLQKLENAKAE